jgi:lipid-A-disaccharide synthase
VDLILCLFPFEPDFYREYGVRAAFVGHPLADQVPMDVDRAAARAELGLPVEARVLAVLPGSRPWRGRTPGGSLCLAAELLAARYPGLVCIAPMVTPALRDLFAERCAALAPRAADTHARRQRARCPRGRRRGAGRIGDGDARGGALQASPWWWPTAWAPSRPSFCATSGS